MKKADKVISINEGLRNYTMHMGAQKEETIVIRAGVDIERFNLVGRKEIRERYGIRDEDILLFFMGWLYDFSGLREVAISLNDCRNRNIKLLIVGNGDLWDDLQSIRKRFHLEDRMIIVDWVPYKETPKYLAASDVCILPAYNNKIMKNIVPIKLYEYMASEKPVISSALQGIMMEFGDDSGIIYVEKQDQIINVAINLAKNGFISSLGKKARKYVEKNNWDNIVCQFERVLSSLGDNLNDQ